MDIDAVITWVDGNDPAHRAKFEAYLASDAPHLKSVEPTRYKDNGEIYVCLASIVKFAPFIRKVVIVTDGQTPPRLDEFKRAFGLAPDFIEVVDHRDIFDGHADCLPTFNSISIETMLHRAPGLAENFLYFNDDFFLFSPTTEETFFRGGVPVIRGSWRWFYTRRIDRLVGELKNRLKGSWKVGRPDFRTSQQVSAKLTGRIWRYFRVDHHPHPIRVSTLKTYLAERGDLLSRQIRHRFRHREQFSMVSLANHLEIRDHGATVLPEATHIYVNADKVDLALLNAKFDTGIREGALWGCVQSIDHAKPEIRAAIWSRLLERFPDLADFVPEDVGHLLSGEAADHSARS